MRRRHFLALGGLLIVGSASISQRWLKISTKRFTIAPPLKPALKGFARTRALGEAYLWKVRQDRKPEELCQRIARAPELKDAANRHGQLRAKVEEDFAQARIVNIGGWFLSETEATLSALVAMS